MNIVQGKVLFICHLFEPLLALSFLDLGFLVSEPCRVPLELWFLVLRLLGGKTSSSPSDSESDSSVRPLNGSFQVLRLLREVTLAFHNFVCTLIDLIYSTYNNAEKS